MYRHFCRSRDGPEPTKPALWPIAARAAGFIAGLALVLAPPPVAEAQGLGERWSELPRERKLLYVNLGMVGTITAWGVAKWDYFQASPNFQSEDWFGRNTQSGGADKLGHAYTSHLLTHVLATRYSAWGYERERAGLYGALSAIGVQSFMEVGDSFTAEYGFSYEDFVANIVGGLTGYFTWQYPALGRTLDFRVEYKPKFDQADFFTDYEHQKYLLAFKLSGFRSLRNGPLRFIELHAGYYARDFEDRVVVTNRRQIYGGIGLNLSEVARAAGWDRTATFLNFYQVPYTYAPVTHHLDR
jgi:hypothetical protein